MTNPNDIGDRIWTNPIFRTGFEQFSSEEAWDWLTRGCPGGESIYHGDSDILIFARCKDKLTKPNYRIDI